MEAYPPPVATNGAHVTGSIGGGLWMVTSHTTQPKAAAALVEYMVTSPKIQENPTHHAGPAGLSARPGRVAQVAQQRLRQPDGDRGRDQDRPRARSGPDGALCRGASSPSSATPSRRASSPAARSRRRSRRSLRTSSPRRRAPAGRSRARQAAGRRNKQRNECPFGTGCSRRARRSPAGAAGPGGRERPPAGSSPHGRVLLRSALRRAAGAARHRAGGLRGLPRAEQLQVASSTSFVDAFNDYRFVPAFEHVLEFMVIWLVSQTILVVGLTLMLHNLARTRRRGLPVPLLHPGSSRRRGERDRLAVHARPDAQAHSRSSCIGSATRSSTTRSRRATSR